MDNWILVLANLKQVEVVCKGQLERIKWYKKGKGADKETPKAFNMCHLPRNFIQAATKETFEPSSLTSLTNKENPNIEEQKQPPEVFC